MITMLTFSRNRAARDEPEQGSGTLLGVGSHIDSLSDYPRQPPTTEGDWYVDGSVTSSGDGSSVGTAFKTIQEGLSALGDGETLLVRGGTYTIGSQITRNTGWNSTTRIMAYGNELPRIDASGISPDTSAIRFNSSSRNELWHGFYVTGVPPTSGSNGQSILVAGGGQELYLTLSRMWVSHCAGDGFAVFNARQVTLKDCAVWRLGDGSTQDTNVPDNYAVKSGSRFVRLVRCFGAHGPDDGYDLWSAQNSEILNCVAYRGGYYWTGNPGGSSVGDGFGLKLAGTGSDNNQATGSISVGARTTGIGNNTIVGTFNHSHNTAVDSGAYGFDFNGNVAGQDGSASGCISLGNQNTHWVGEYYTTFLNTWNLGITDASFGNPSENDWSLLPGSDALGVGPDGSNLGASTEALEIAKTWISRDLSGYATAEWVSEGVG